MKAKSVYDGHFIFELDEVEKLARLFNLTVYFACLDADQPDRHWWVPLADLQARPPERRGKRRVVTMATLDAYDVDLNISFLGVMMQFSFYVLDKG